MEKWMWNVLPEENQQSQSQLRKENKYNSISAWLTDDKLFVFFVQGSSSVRSGVLYTTVDDLLHGIGF